MQLTESVKLERLLTPPAKSPPKLYAVYKENQIVNLAIVADSRGDSETAAKLRRRAQFLREEPQYPFGSLFPSEI